MKSSAGEHAIPRDPEEAGVPAYGGEGIKLRIFIALILAVAVLLGFFILALRADHLRQSPIGSAVSGELFSPRGVTDSGAQASRPIWLLSLLGVAVSALLLGVFYLFLRRIQKALALDITERKLAEQSLRTSEANMAAAQRIAHFASWELDLTHAGGVNANPLRWSDEMFRIAGYEPGAVEVSNELFFSLVPAEEHASIREAVAAAIREHGVYSISHRIIRPDGEARTVLEVGQVSVDAKTGQPLKIVGTAHDITERQQAEEALREIELRLAHAMSLAQLFAWEYDVAGGFFTFSDRYYALHGTTAEQEGGNRMSAAEFVRRFVDPEDAGIVAAEIGKAMATADPDYRAQIECRLFRRDGELRTVLTSISVVKDAAGQTTQLHGANQDITERKRAEEALCTSERLLEKAMRENQQVLDESLDVVCTIDAAGRFTSLSAACEKLFGYSPAEMIGRPFLDFVLEDDRAATIAGTALLPTGHELHDFENRYLRKDGTAVTIAWSATCSAADQGIFCVGRDCTERKQAEEAEAARQAAERANVAKSEFLSRMSHELRTPMNAILGFAQVLESEEGLTTDQRDSVDQILNGGGHLLELINEVLDISSIEAGRMTLSSESIALPGLLAETVGLLRPLAGDFDVRIAVSSSADGHVQADRQRLKQVLLNLLGNAIKYNRPGGRVTVGFEALGGSPATTRLAVSDTGAGLSADRLARLFQPFERLGAEHTHVEGTGLGLVLARHMVEHMGGTLGVESVVGEGTTFWIELPTAEAPVEPEEATSEAVPAFSLELSAETRVLLYIEDNPSNVRLVTRILSRRPAIQLLSAETGALGLTMAREHHPDLILLDLHLPDSHGAEVLARLGADPRTAGIPVVMLSADAVPGKRDHLLAAGARAFMTKPLNVRNFLAVVDRFLTAEPVEAV